MTYTEQVLRALKENSTALIEDGLILAERHRYSRAYMCFQAAIDEMNEYLAIDRAEKEAPINWPAIDVALLNDHTVLEKDTVIEQALVRLIKQRAFQGEEVETLTPFIQAIDAFKRLINGDEQVLVEALDEPLQHVMFEEMADIHALMVQRNELRQAVLHVQITNDRCYHPEAAITKELMVEIGMAALANQLMLNY